MRSLLLIALALVLAAPAADARPRKSTLSVADRKHYKELLRKARKLEAQKDFASAIAALEDCLKVAPDDATALGELGFTLFRANQLDRAEATTRKALQGQAAPNVRGATLYNLGLIREARSDKPGAIAAYRDSLKVRPNATVRTRLAALDATAAAQIDPYAPIPLVAVASIEAFCAKQPATDDEGLDCSCGAAADAPAMKLAAPYRGVAIFERRCTSGQYGTVRSYVAVATAAGLFVGGLHEFSFDRHCDETFDFKDVHALGDKLLVTYAVEGACANGDDEDDWRHTGVAIVGGTTPAMTPALIIKRHETHQEGEGPDQTTVNVDLAMTWGADGSLEVKGKTIGLDKTEAGRLLGKHNLTFP